MQVEIVTFFFLNNPLEGEMIQSWRQLVLQHSLLNVLCSEWL